MTEKKQRLHEKKLCVSTLSIDIPIIFLEFDIPIIYQTIYCPSYTFLSLLQLYLLIRVVKTGQVTKPG